MRPRRLSRCLADSILSCGMLADVPPSKVPLRPQCKLVCAEAVKKARERRKEGCGGGPKTESRHRKLPFINLSASICIYSAAAAPTRNKPFICYCDCSSVQSETVSARANHRETFIVSSVQKKERKKKEQTEGCRHTELTTRIGHRA